MATNKGRKTGRRGCSAEDRCARCGPLLFPSAVVIIRTRGSVPDIRAGAHGGVKDGESTQQQFGTSETADAGKLL